MLPQHFLSSLHNLLPQGQVFTDRAALIAYEADAGLDKGLPDAVMFPRSTEEVVRIVRWAVEHNVPLIARGAGTGLSGGAVAERGGIIVEFVHMHAISTLDVQGRRAIVQPALINLRLDQEVKRHGLYFPPDPSSQRASTIGGNVAENAGGPHCFKYGVTTNYVTGMSVVLADGTCIQLGGHALDYPEYDLCSLLAGSEGMLGLMTSISLRLIRNPPGVKTLLAVFNSTEQAGEAVSAVIASGLVPATMEMMDQKIMRIIEPFAHAGLPLDAGAVLIIEVDGFVEGLDRQADEIQDILLQHGAYNLRIARDEDERAKIWLARKSAAGSIAREVPAYYTIDITIPRSRLTEMLSEVNRICACYDVRVGQVFHAGDGNLHPMLLIPDPDDASLMHRVHQAGHEIVEYCVGRGGSLTGEHGVGIEKRDYMPLMHNAAELQAMWDIKRAFDPALLLNPGKVFPLVNEDTSSTGHVLETAHIPAVTAQKLPDGVLMPATAQEAAESLAALSLSDQQATITGSAQPELLNPPSRICYLSTCALQGIKEYAPNDLYITVGAGTTLRSVQHFLAQKHKMLPLLSPWPETTIGGLIATNSNAPLRMRYGALRDLVLCATVALPDGRVIRTGRPLVKNVAGFDLTRIFVGSYGTLGLLCDVSLKIVAPPRSIQTLLVPVASIQQGLQLGMRMTALTLTASAIVLCKDYVGENNLHSPYLLAYTAEGLAEDVQAELAQVQAILKENGASVAHEVQTVTGTQLWSEYLSDTPKEALLLRIGIPASKLPTYIEEQIEQLKECRYIVDLANGFLYIQYHAKTVEQVVTNMAALRESAIAAGGYALAMAIPHHLQGHVEHWKAWNYQAEGLAIAKRLKACWDSHDILHSDTSPHLL